MNNQFKEYLQKQGKSDNTITSYLSTINLYNKHINQTTPTFDKTKQFLLQIENNESRKVKKSVLVKYFRYKKRHELADNIENWSWQK